MLRVFELPGEVQADHNSGVRNGNTTTLSSQHMFPALDVSLSASSACSFIGVIDLSEVEVRRGQFTLRAVCNIFSRWLCDDCIDQALDVSSRACRALPGDGVLQA